MSTETDWIIARIADELAEEADRFAHRDWLEQLREPIEDLEAEAPGAPPIGSSGEL